MLALGKVLGKIKVSNLESLPEDSIRYRSLRAGWKAHRSGFGQPAIIRGIGARKAEPDNADDIWQITCQCEQFPNVQALERWVSVQEGL